MRQLVVRTSATLLLAAGLTVVAPHTAEAADPQYCDEGRAAPCLVSVTRDGVPVDRATYLATVDGYSPSEAPHMTGFTLNKTGLYGLGPAELGHVFVVTMDVGNIEPRIVDAWGRNGHSTRIDDGDGTWKVAVTVEPADMLMSCTSSGGGAITCPAEAAAANHIQYIVARIDDGYWFGDTDAERDRMWGLEAYSDINLFWYPPAITVASDGVVTMDFLMMNSHSYFGGATFYGHANVRLTNNVLRELYGIPNPETMTPGSFTSTTTSGTVTSAPEAGDAAWLVTLDGVTFSKQHLRLTRGVITPTRPRDVRAVRVNAHRGKVFGASSPRGAKVRGYAARCVAGRHVVTGSATTSPVVVSGLHTGRRYECRITARSKAGPSRASAVVVLPARG